jgi:hydroxymethylpyrimidine/phosphomethylpyrimidine kinase
MTTRPVALTIAGSDPSGGAGIQADLKTFHQFGVYGEAVVTLITVQNTVSVDRVECLAPDLVEQQIRAVVADIRPDAVKTGALGRASIIEAAANVARELRLKPVVDPVIVSKHGARLLDADAVDILKRLLLPQALLVTPNLDEAALLTGRAVNDLKSMRAAAEDLAALGASAVLVKGGHLEGDAADLLYYRGEWLRFTCPRIDTKHTHGTGCTYSAAITAGLAQGLDLAAAVRQAKSFIHAAISTAPGLGRGSGPVNHHTRKEENATGCTEATDAD